MEEGRLLRQMVITMKHEPPEARKRSGTILAEMFETLEKKAEQKVRARKRFVYYSSITLALIGNEIATGDG